MAYIPDDVYRNDLRKAAIMPVTLQLPSFVESGIVMKQTVIILVLLCFVSKAESHITRRDVWAARAKYMAEKRPSVRACDSLTWEGLKAIRAGRKLWMREKPRL